MKIAVTGATGFIGSHFTKQALAAGHAVLAIRRSPASTPRIPMEQLPQWLDRALDEVTAEDLKGCDVLVHLAAHTGNVPYDTLANCLRWNLIAVVDLFEQARLAGIRRFVVAGSCFEYGRSGERYEAIPTDAPLKPTNSYAASKAAASIALCQWAEEYQLSLELLRVFHVYGEGEPETRFWPSLKRAALASQDFPMTLGNQVRDFMPVNSVAKTFLSRALLSDATNPEVKIYNLTTNCHQSLATFAKSWWSKWNAQKNILFGAKVYRSGEVMRYLPGESILTVHIDDSDLAPITY